MLDGVVVDNSDQGLGLFHCDDRQRLSRMLQRSLLVDPCVRLSGNFVDAERNKLLTIGEDLQLLILAVRAYEFVRRDFGETLIRAD